MRTWTSCIFATVASLTVGSGSAHAEDLTDAQFEAATQRTESSDPMERVAAVELLGEQGTARRDALTRILRRLLRNDPDWRVRASSARAVGRLNIRQAVPDLIAALRHPQVEVRVVAAAALWRLPDPAAVPPLVVMLQDQDASARQWAVVALGVSHDPRAVQPLGALLTDRDSTVRLDVLRSLGRIGQPGARAPLLAFAQDARHVLEERIEAVGALALLGGPETGQALVALLRDAEEAIRLAAIQGIERTGDRSLARTLRRRIRREPSRTVRIALLSAARALEAPASAPAPQ